MLDAIPVDGPADIDALAGFLSANAETGCMTLSELDGYLAGVVVSPILLLPSAWLIQIWGQDGPPFADEAQARDILRAVMCRYNEIVRQVGEGPAAYHPILGAGHARAESVIDWGIGFMHALGFEPEAWLKAMHDHNGMVLLMPILALAAEMPMSIDVDEFKLPKGELRKLIAGADTLLPMCVCGLQLFWERSAQQPGKRRATPGKKTRRANASRRA